MQKKIWITLFVLFIIAIILTLNTRLPLASSLEGFVQTIFSSPKQAMYALSVNSRHSATDQIQQLKNENKKLAAQLVEVNTLKEDNFALRSQLKDTPVSMSRLIESHVVGFSGDPHFPDTLVIDQGEASGMKKNMTVVYGKNFVGTITSVLKNYSVVSLVNQKNFSFLGKTIQNNTLGIVQGGENVINFNQVVITDPLKVGDIVVTRGEVGSSGVGILPDLIVGKVISVSHVPSASFQSARVASMLDFAKLTTLFVIAQ